MRGRLSSAVSTSNFNLKFRPLTYTDHSDPVSALLAEAAGKPAPLICDEVTIARIVFGTLAPNVVEIRARPRLGHFVYRVVDDLGTEFRLNDRISDYPMSLGQLIRMIERSNGISEEPGLVLPVLDAVFGNYVQRPNTGYVSAGDRSALVDAVRAFVRVESDIYLELESYFESEVDDWLASQRWLLRTGDLEGIDRRKLEPALSPVPGWSGVAGSHSGAIDRLVRAWWRSERAPDTTDTRLDLGQKTNQLRKALRTYVSRHGRLPAGRFQVVSGQSSWTVDIDDLTETGELIERVLLEGTQLPVTDLEWLAGCQDHVAVYEFGSWLYIAHPWGIDGPFDEDTLAEWFYEGILTESGTLEVELDWDSGGPGAGAGTVSAYRIFGLLFVIDDMGLNGPYDDFEHAVRRHGLYTVNGATTRIRDAAHGLVFDRGVLYRPDVVARYGKIYVDVTVDSEA